MMCDVATSAEARFLFRMKEGNECIRRTDVLNAQQFNNVFIFKCMRFSNVFFQALHF